MNGLPQCAPYQARFTHPAVNSIRIAHSGSATGGICASAGLSVDISCMAIHREGVYVPRFHAGTDESRMAQKHPTRGAEILAQARDYHGVAPGKHNTTNYLFAISGRITDEELAYLKGYRKKAIDEDVFATVEIERKLANLAHAPKDSMLHSDRNATWGSKVLQAMMD